MSLTLNRLIFLQIIYCAAGLLYNVASLLALRDGAAAWAPTDAVFGVVGMTTYLLFVATAMLEQKAIYRFLMAIAVLLMGYNGVLKHVFNFADLGLYQSVWTWLSAILVNSCGTVLALIGACGLFQSSSNQS
jgi:hypothetical protein